MEQQSELNREGIAVGTHFSEHRYLYAFAPLFELQRYIRTQAVEDDASRLPEIVESWRAVQPRVAAVQLAEAAMADAVRVAAIPDAVAEKVRRIAAEPLFLRTFSSHPTGFAMVEVSRLIAAQRVVNMEYVDRLASGLGENPNIEDLIDFTLCPSKTKEPIQHLELGDNVHAFSSPNTDLRFLGAFQKEIDPGDLKYAIAGGVPAIGVMAFVGYGASSANAFRVGSRLYLNNGFHRMVALQQLRIEMAPIVLQEVENVQLEFPQAIAGVPREYLLNTPRPALLGDFANHDFTTVLRVKSRARLVVVNLAGAVAQHDVPA